MGKLVSNITVSFGDNSPMSSLPLGLRLDNHLTATSNCGPVTAITGHPKYKFTNYSYFLTISMKNSFGTADEFYHFIRSYFSFVKQNTLCEAVDVSFEYYKDHKKLHAHALLDFHCPDNNYKEYRVQQSRFRNWSKEYFKVRKNITLDRKNFYMYKICDKHKTADVNITKEYLIKDRDMMVKLNFKPIVWWVKQFTKCVRLVTVAKPKNLIQSKEYKETIRKQLAEHIHGNLDYYNHQKKILL